MPIRRPTVSLTLDVAHAVVLLALSIGVYGATLDRERLRPEEVQVAATARALEHHGWRDPEGRFLPLFVHVSDETWLDPIPTYTLAYAIGGRPVAFEQLRWMAVLTAALNVLLLYAVARQIFVASGYAFVAALLLLVSPAHLTYSRFVTTDGIWMLPFVLVSLTAFATAVRTGRSWALVLSGAAIGVSGYTQPAAALLAPLLLLVELVGLRRASRLTAANARLICGSFAITLVPCLVWFAVYPSTYLDTLGRWLLHPAHLRSPLAWARASTNWYTASTVLGTYWDFFNPAHLFVSDTVAGHAGVFLWPVGVLIVVGLFQGLRRRDQQPAGGSALVLTAAMGFVVSPMAAATFKEPRAIQRALIIVPFGVLLATTAVHMLWSRGDRASRMALVLLLAAALVQFAIFWRGSIGGP